MSRSNPQSLSNPCNLWLEWDGANGQLRYYDKGKKENVPVPLPFTFLWLDQLSKMAGWSDQDQAWIYSNEVRDLSADSMRVAVYSGPTIAEGLYSNIKDTAKARGAKFVSSVYCMVKLGEDYQLANIGLKGAALHAWIEFSKEHYQEIHDGAVQISSYEEDKKGSVSFRVPVFELTSVSEQAGQMAKQVDQQLQEYLDTRKVAKKEQANEQANRAFDEAAMDDIDDLPF